MLQGESGSLPEKMSESQKVCIFPEKKLMLSGKRTYNLLLTANSSFP